ncbi:spore protease YyaC [Limnochorda pilosa]|uniref:Sporulation protein n=1 Tax=Limnochorda pilosa TaxID=1555112 RepID=A0A0K2SQR7_LIMPI|nr:sporulation protein [Limnochorda pilosa]
MGPDGSRHERLVPRVHVEEEGAAGRLAGVLARYLQEPWQNGRDILFLCIGTDRSTGDSLGPLVGSQLAALEPATSGRVRVRGTLEAPVHASNLHEAVRGLREPAPGPFVVAIDACLGRAENVGCLTVRPGPLLPGTGVNKSLPAVGDVQVLGVVNVGGFMEYFVLQNTRLSAVLRMVDVVSDAVWQAMAGLTGGEGRRMHQVVSGTASPSRSATSPRISFGLLPTASITGAAVTRVSNPARPSSMPETMTTEADDRPS